MLLFIIYYTFIQNLTSIELRAKLIGYDIIILANALAENKVFLLLYSSILTLSKLHLDHYVHKPWFQ